MALSVTNVVHAVAVAAVCICVICGGARWGDVPRCVKGKKNPFEVFCKRQRKDFLNSSFLRAPLVSSLTPPHFVLACSCALPYCVNSHPRWLWLSFWARLLFCICFCVYSLHPTFISLHTLHSAPFFCYSHTSCFFSFLFLFFCYLDRFVNFQTWTT